VTIDLRANLHEKLVCVDGNIVWYGSLNPLSHTGQTDELMIRAESKALANTLAQHTSLRMKKFGREDNTIEMFTERENPPCPVDQNITVLYSGRYGPFWACLGGCGWKESIDGARRKKEPRETGITCPECGRPMAIRAGKRGHFLGCTGYPECKHTESVKSLKSSP
jgi:hypothetical protein